MSEQISKVTTFFDNIAAQYAQKYGKTNLLTEYFFQQRLQAALEDIDIKGKKILDIGAGTGPLFDALQAQDTQFDYWACDISEKILQQSNIPITQYHVGQVFDIDWGNTTFNYIFILGVNTYMTENDWQKTINFVHQRLAPNGKTIVSFTNQRSYDIKIRRFFRPLMSFWNKKNVIAQAFDIQTFDYQIFIKKNPDFVVTKMTWLNQTLSGINRIVPKMSIRFATFLLKKYKNNPLVLQKWSSDFLLILEKKE